MTKNEHNGRKLAIGAAIGVVAGYVTGILTAPKSGKETRKDIKDTASKAMREADKQLKKLSGELSDLIALAEKEVKIGGEKAKAELQKALEAAKVSKQRVREMISAIRSGEADDPDLQQAVKEATAAKDHLQKYLKNN